MIVESASPVLVVKTVLSVLAGAAESSRTNCLSVTCSGVDARAGPPRRRPRPRPSWRR